MCALTVLGSLFLILSLTRFGVGAVKGEMSFVLCNIKLHSLVSVANSGLTSSITFDEKKLSSAQI